MPSDANGVYSLPPGYLVRVGDLIIPGQHNPVFEDIGTALSARLSLSGAAPMTGPLKAAVGSAAAPGYTFAGHIDAGFYKTTDGVGLAIGGVLAFEVTAAGLTQQLKGIPGTAAAPGFSFVDHPDTGFYETAGGVGISVGGVLLFEVTPAGLTQALHEIAGSAAAPSYSFSGAVSSGMYKTAAGIGISIGGGLVFEVTPSGLTQQLKAAVGAGAAAPGYGFAGAGDTGVYKTAAGVGISVGGTLALEVTPSGMTVYNAGSPLLAIDSSVQTTMRRLARYVGELFPYVGSTAPALSVFPVGQTLSRAGYADLWTLAQAEIAAGNVFFNSGNGSTTFGIGDLRGRVPVCNDAMGGAAAGVLSSTYYGANPAVMGTIGGSQSNTLTLGQLPTGITSANLGAIGLSVLSTVSDIARAPNGITSSNATGGIQSQLQANTALTAQITSTGNIGIGAAAVTSNNTSGQPHPNVQPSLITNYALFAGA